MNPRGYPLRSAKRRHNLQVVFSQSDHQSCQELQEEFGILDDISPPEITKFELEILMVDWECISLRSLEILLINLRVKIFISYGKNTQSKEFDFNLED